MDPFTIALKRHADDPSPRIHFDVPIDRLMDQTYCATLNADLERATPHGWERRVAMPDMKTMIPNAAGVYMFVWHPMFSIRLAATETSWSFPWILYIGKAGGRNSAGTLRSRYRGEYSKYVRQDPERLWEGPQPGRKGMLSRYLTLLPLEYWYAVVDEPDLVDDLEARLYNLIAPPLNSSGGPRLRPTGKREKAF